MAGDGTLGCDWWRAAVSVVLRILRNTCGLTKGSRGFPQPGDTAGYADCGGVGGVWRDISYIITLAREGWENRGNNRTMKRLVISRHLLPLWECYGLLSYGGQHTVSIGGNSIQFYFLISSIFVGVRLRISQIS